jgi:hypothetical protein
LPASSERVTLEAGSTYYLVGAYNGSTVRI